MGTLMIRADANDKIGTGHVMRCLALAQAWHATGGETVFALTPGAEALVPRLKSEGSRIEWLAAVAGSNEDAYATAELARKNNARWVILDGYCFGPAYQQRIKEAKLSLLFVDDHADAAHYCADIVLNQSPAARENLYARYAPDTRLLLGPRYVLLRQEFLRWRNRKRESPKQATRLLVTLGGADPENVTSKVISVIQELRLPTLQTKVVIGPLNSNLPALQGQLRRKRHKITLLTEQPDMPALMSWADAAISAAGSTSWELCFMGVPSILIVLAKNQVGVAGELQKKHAAVNLGPYEHVSPRLIAGRLRKILLTKACRAEMTKHARGLVDGEGARRVVAKLQRAALELRRVQPDDCQLLWEWANDPEVRATSFSKDPIPWKDHVAWFTRKMAERHTILLLAVDGQGHPAGQVRLELLPQKEAVMHISVAPLRRGSGIGRCLIAQVVHEFSCRNKVQAFHAYVRPENQRSIKVFERSGFSLIGRERVRGTASLHFLRHIADRAIAS